MIDVRDQLKRSDTQKQALRLVTNVITRHYNGPAIGAMPTLKLLQADARFHVDTRGWDGLSYHYAIGKDGEQFLCRDDMARLNHCGVAQGNNESLAVLVALVELVLVLVGYEKCTLLNSIDVPIVFGLYCNALSIFVIKGFVSFN